MLLILIGHPVEDDIVRLDVEDLLHVRLVGVVRTLVNIELALDQGELFCRRQRGRRVDDHGAVHSAADVHKRRGRPAVEHKDAGVLGDKAERQRLPGRNRLIPDIPRRGGRMEVDGVGERGLVLERHVDLVTLPDVDERRGYRTVECPQRYFHPGRNFLNRVPRNDRDVLHVLAADGRQRRTERAGLAVLRGRERARRQREQRHQGTCEQRRSNKPAWTTVCVHKHTLPVLKISISGLIITSSRRRGNRSATVSRIRPQSDLSGSNRLGVRRRRRRPFWIVVIVPAIVIGGLCTWIEAHALLERSVPQNGVTLSHPPGEVLLVFTEQPEPDLSAVRVLDASARTVTGGVPRPVRGRPLELRVPLPRLSQGTYTVTWRTVSRIDGHVAAGAFSFGVGVAPSTPLPPQALNPPPSALYVLSHMLLYLGFSGLLAIAVAGAAAPPLGGTFRPFLLPTWAVAAVGLVLLGVAQARDAGIGLLRLLGTPL